MKSRLPHFNLSILVVFMILPAFGIELSAQRIIWNEEPNVKKTLDEYKSMLQQRTKIEGWRVQFYSTTDRRNMENTIKQLKRRFPGIKFTWIYTEPFYQIRAGAFLYRKDTLPLQNLLKKEFAGAFPITDEIDVLDLLENN
jgi:hypothetical protein